MLVTSGTLTHRVDRLASRGCVERLPDPHDRRGVLVRLTPEGKATVDGAFAASYAALAPFLNPGSGSCAPKGASCTSNGDCCSNSCKGKPGAKVCK